MLSTILKNLDQEGYFINNVDINLICEKPKVSKYRDRIINSISKIITLDKKQTAKIENYAVGHGTLKNCPEINENTLREKGFTDEQFTLLESSLSSAFDIKFVFNRYTFGDDFCKNVLNFSDQQLNDINFNMLSEIGFTDDQIEIANTFICGAMTLEAVSYTHLTLPKICRV